MAFEERQFLNVQNNNGKETGEWKYKFVVIENNLLLIYENEDCSKPTNSLQLSEIVLNDEDGENSIISDLKNLEIELDLGLDSSTNNNDNLYRNNEKQIILSFKEKMMSGNIWNIEMKSKDMLNNWLREIQKSKELVYGEYKQKEYSKKKYGMCTSKKVSIIGILFVVYTIILVVLFSCLWVKYVSPILNVKETITDCLIKSHESKLVSRGVYNYKIDVVYRIYTDEVLSETANQYCFGYWCPYDLNDRYPINSEMTCYYDRDDVTFVYFNLYPMKRYRYQVTFGLCGTMLGFWVIWLLINIVILKNVKR